MRIVVTSNGVDLEAPASPIFGRCRTYIFVETDTMSYEVVENPAIGAAGGAGIQAAQFIVQQGAQAVVTGNLGPNAFSVLQSAGVPIYLFGGGSARQAAEAFRTGQLQSIADATAQAGAGMGAAGLGLGAGSGLGMGRGMGMGRGIGMGRGRGRGMGMGRSTGGGTQLGVNAAGQGAVRRTGLSATPETPRPAAEASREDEIAELKEASKRLKEQLAQVMERLEQLQSEI